LMTRKDNPPIAERIQLNLHNLCISFVYRRK
jgi:hypothetical protein